MKPKGFSEIRFVDRLELAGDASNYLHQTSRIPDIMDNIKRSPKRQKVNNIRADDDDRQCSGELWLEYHAAEAEYQAEEEEKRALAASDDKASSPKKETDGHNTESEQKFSGDDNVSRIVDTEQATAPNLSFSKSQQKKLRRKQEWEAGREDRKAYKKEKRKEKQARKRAAREEESKEPLQDATNDSTSRANLDSQSQHQSNRHRPIQLPVTIIFDCDFDDLMIDKERISLSSQLTRSYSDNFKAKFRYHLAIASFGGHMKERFDTVLSKHYLNWKRVRIFEEDFVDVAGKSKVWLAEKQAGQLAGAFDNTSLSAADGERGEPTEELASERGETIYLTSDSPNTLNELKPYSTYIIGGLVDRNRHKGICYKRACDRGVQTARLPIGEYMEMASRFVLATNHVAEIMLRWLECRDWGKAFLEVVPKRKGGVLKETGKEAREMGAKKGDHGRAPAANGEQEDEEERSEEGSDAEGRNGEERGGKKRTREERNEEEEEEAISSEVDEALGKCYRDDCGKYCGK